jgi:hypothetical protein
MAKIGILTFHWANHFGAILQAWALNKILEDMGYDAEIINFLPILRLINSRVIKPSELAQKYLIISSSIKSIFFATGEAVNYILNFKDEMLKNCLFEDFRKNFMKIHKKAISSVEELKRKCIEYDICLVGSDQVWNPQYLRHSHFAYLLPFKLDGTKKIAFSASIGVDPYSISSAMIKLYRRALSEFSFISLREKSHSPVLSSIIGRKICHTLDPTLLVERGSLETIMDQDISLPHDKYVLIYNIDFSMLPLAEKILQTFELPAIIYVKPPFLPIKRKLTFSKNFKNALCFSSAGPREFLTLLRNAEFIITNSYHATALSIVFKKPFVVIISDSIIEVKSRIFDLLDLFRMRNRVYSRGKNLQEIVHEPIDYDHVSELMNYARRNSLELLRKALKG